MAAIVVLLVTVASALNLAYAPKPSAPTLGPPATLSANDLTATQAAAATQSANEHTLAVTLAAVMQVTPGSALLGINPAGAVPAPAGVADFVPQNVWVGLINGSWFGVYAGALRSDPLQGALVLVTITAERVDRERLVTPLSHGALRIVGQNVQRLTLAAPDGTTYFFDVQARTFVGSLIAYADTATPLPSLTPTVTATPSPSLTAAATSASPTMTPTP